MKNIATLFLLLCAWSQSIYAQSGLKTFDNSYVHEIRIYFDDPNFWDTLTQHYIISVDTTIENVPLMAQVNIDGTLVDSVGVSQKGYFSNWGAGSSLKKPLKLDFNEFAEDGKYDKLKSLNLQNAFRDPSLMRDMLSYQILRDFGVAAPRTSYCRVYINDTYWGLYVLVESVNKTFLKEHFGNNDGNLYKANYTSLQYKGDDQSAYSDDFELKTNESENDWSGLIKFIKAVNTTPANVFKDTLSKKLDLQSYFKSLALDVTINNWDSHFEHGRNFYLYDNPEDGKFYWIPWDYNLAFAGDTWINYDIALNALTNNPQYDKILPKRVLKNQALRQQYLNVACQLHREIFTLNHLEGFIDNTRDLIYTDLENDPNKFYQDMAHFEISLSGGGQVAVTESFHVIDSTWNGSAWEIIDTVIVFEYFEQIAGLKDMITERNASIQSELEFTYHIDCSTPVQEPGETLSLEVWPNPAAEVLTITATEAGTFTLYDAGGRVKERTTLEASQTTLPLTSFSTGIYWVEFTTARERSVQKLIVQR